MCGRARSIIPAGENPVPARRPEAKYLKSKKHGIKWTEGSATAKSTGLPQGLWGSKADLNFVGKKLVHLNQGKVIGLTYQKVTALRFICQMVQQWQPVVFGSEIMVRVHFMATQHNK